MLRSTLLLTAGLVLLPASALAQGSNCPLHKKLEAQQQSVTQVAELAPTVSSQVQAPLTSTPRQTVIAPLTASPEAVIERTAQSSYKPAPQAPVKVATPSPHAAWTGLLQKYVSAPDGQGLTHFNYGGLKSNSADRAQLDGYIKSLGATNPDTLSRDEAIAFYANLYNAVTIDLIVQNYPLGSIRKAKAYNGAKVGGFTGPWKKTAVSVNGQSLSLDSIEHKVLRVKYPSPYVHYMVNCASVGCPNLLGSAWTASNYESLRKQAAADYINSPRGVVVTSKGLKVSSIFKWFADDFGGSKATVLRHIREHADADLAAAIDAGAKIVDYDYDWSVNE